MAMSSRITRCLRLGICLLLACTISALTVFVERIGPEQRSYGNLCGENHDTDCLQPVLKGGYPWAYLLDAPGVSVEHQLFVGEDEFLPRALALDVLFWAAALHLADRLFRRLRRSPTSGR